jgi:hemoglobin-like flavoprotein
MSLNVNLLRHSFALVVERQPRLTSRFYEILFARHPEARPLFGSGSTEKQAAMLQEALVAVMDHLEDASWLEQTLAGLGSKHADYGVTDEMYGWVGSSLLATLAEVAGDAWTPELERAWYDAYGAIAGLMRNGARKAASGRTDRAPGPAPAA